MKPEGKDLSGYLWIQDMRYDDYYYLKDFEHLIVSKVYEPQEAWEAAVFEDETCQKMIIREKFPTLRAAQECLENYLEKTIKNRKL
jgi:hypothetical protein